MVGKKDSIKMYCLYMALLIIIEEEKRMLEGYALNKDREEKVNKELIENKQTSEFWLLMDVINVIQDKYVEYRRLMNESIDNSNREYEKRYYFQQLAINAVEEGIWELYDKWEEINGVNSYAYKAR